MDIKNSMASLLTLLLIVGISTAANASPRNSNGVKAQITQLELKEAQSLLKVSQMELAYQRLLNNSKLQSAKVTDKKTTNPRNKKVSFKSQSKINESDFDQRLKVTATAYTSHADQTDSTPNIAAWGDRLKPGMKAIAVSRDLLKVYGLKHKQKVRIKGLKGEYTVLDKMNKRWRKKIDIYMGMNKKKAFRWGRRKVEILWNS